MATKPTADDSRGRIAFEIESRTDSSFGDSYWHGIARPVRVMPDGTLRNDPDDDYGYGTGPTLLRLQISCQMDARRAAEPNPTAYAWTAEYRDAYAVDLRTAERMVLTLRAISRRLATLAGRYGDPSTFGQYAVRCADALGISEFVIPRGPNAPTWAEPYRIGDAAAAVDWFAAREREYVASVAPEAVRA